uniref:Aquaporin n=1 Tax=Ornithorhynchus anatinus TaxID=9258 RepID=A0A6I8NJZ5_ORNAN
MAGLNVSLSFFFIVVAVCEAARRLSKRSLPAPVYGNLARELIGAFQLGACCLELRMLVVIGPWGGGYGPDVILTLLFLLFLVHGLTWDGASANPITSLREFLTAEASAPVAAVRAAAHLAGTYAGDALTRLYWSWELTDFHLIQNLMGRECSSALQTAVAWGVLVEATCAFFYHLTLLCFQHSRPLYRAPAVALIVTLLAYTAGPFTSAFFNPALASAVTFHCSGNTLLEYVQVYWLGPAAGKGGSRGLPGPAPGAGGREVGSAQSRAPPRANGSRWVSGRRPPPETCLGQVRDGRKKSTSPLRLAPVSHPPAPAPGIPPPRPWLLGLLPRSGSRSVSSSRAGSFGGGGSEGSALDREVQATLTA